MKVFIIKSKIIYLNLDSNGWYIEVNDGYCSNYYSTKSEALKRVKEIKNEIKNNNW